MLRQIVVLLAVVVRIVVVLIVVFGVEDDGIFVFAVAVFVLVVVCVLFSDSSWLPLLRVLKVV